MRTSAIIFLFVLISTTGFCENIFDKLMKLPQYTIDVYNAERIGDEQLRLDMDFANSHILNRRDLAKLEDRQVVMIDLVYTDFRTAESFDQPELNRDRLKALWKLQKELVTNTDVRWRFIAQTQCKSKTCAEDLFHGFIITHRPRGKDASKADMAMVKEALDAIPLEVDSVEMRCIPKEKKRKEWTGAYVPKAPWKAERGITYDKPGIWKRRREMETKYDRWTDSIPYTHYKPSPEAYGLVMQILPDSTFFEVMDRHPDWKDVHIFCDVTGSMSPYTAQLITWLQLNLHKRDIDHCTFFNDGDSTPDRRKIIGNTGGIYHTEADGYKKVERKMITAMTAGGGGDAPENNVEALLEGFDKFDSQGDIVMVADNLAPIKDKSLIEMLDRPVHVILCGTGWGGVNIDYVNLAYKTGGSVHAMEEDLNDLISVSEGEEIEFLGQKFILEGGRFEPVYRL
jgi:hypothetical protein